MTRATSIRIAAAVVFLGIALGAFGAHGLEETLQKHDHVETWKTASLYHLLHGVVLFVIALTSSKRTGYTAFLVGILVFSGSLYLLSVTGYSKLGAITPIGGLAFLLGWAQWIFAKTTNLNHTHHG